MTRDEWMVLPNGMRVHRSLDGRRYFEACGVAHYCCPAEPEALSTGVPLAEFEALLFGAEPDAYTRAAVAYAEAHAAVMNLPAFDPALEGEYRRIRDPFLRLYRERHDVQR